MKQLLTVILCVFLVGMTTGSVRAETGIGGYFIYKYKLLDGSDDAYSVFNFNSKVNDQAMAYLSMTVSGTDREFKSDSFYVIYKEKYGTYTIGRFSYGTGNSVILGNTFGGLISNVGFKFEYPCLEVLTLKYGFFHQMKYGTDYYDSYTVGCDYNFEKYFIGLNLIKPGNVETAGYTLNVSTNLNGGSKIYLHYGQDQDGIQKGNIGFLIGSSTIPLTTNIEHSLLPDASNYGCQLKYQISTNTFLGYNYLHNGTTDTTNELMMIFFF